MRNGISVAFATVLGVLSGANASHAAIIAGTYSFTASGFTTAAPVNPATGAVQVTFDNSSNHSAQSSGLSLTSSNISLGSALEFTYLSIPDILILGGAAATVTNSDPSSADFALFIAGASTSSPIVTSFTYSVGSGAVYTATTESVTFSPASSVPEPASWAMLGAAVLGMTGLRRRQSP